MEAQKTETELRQLLLVVESAQRAGRSEREIGELLEDALAADAELDRAA